MKKWLKRVGGTIRESLRLFSRSDMIVYAGNASMLIVLAVFPFLILTLSVVNLIPGFTPETVLSFLNEMLPDLSAFQDLIRSIVTTVQGQSSGILISISALVTLWSASNGITALQTGLRRLRVHRRVWIHHKAVALVFTFALTVLLPVFVLLNIEGHALVDMISRWSAMAPLRRMLDDARAVLRVHRIITTALLLPALMVIYSFLPGRRLPARSVFPGALAAALGSAVFTYGFSFFISEATHASVLYGSLASLFLILLWLRIVVALVFYGACLNRVLEGKKVDPDPPDAADAVPLSL